MIWKNVKELPHDVCVHKYAPSSITHNIPAITRMYLLCGKINTLLHPPGVTGMLG